MDCVPLHQFHSRKCYVFVGSPAPSTAANDAPVQERSEFNLKLESFDAASKIKVIKEVRSITDLGLKEAKELVSAILKGLVTGLEPRVPGH